MGILVAVVPCSHQCLLPAQLYVVGGNGGNAAANAIYKQCQRDGVLCSVIGVPKSIDNDIQLIDKCAPAATHTAHA